MVPLGWTLPTGFLRLNMWLISGYKSTLLNGWAMKFFLNIGPDAMNMARISGSSLSYPWTPTLKFSRAETSIGRVVSGGRDVVLRGNVSFSVSCLRISARVKKSFGFKKLYAYVLLYQILDIFSPLDSRYRRLRILLCLRYIIRFQTIVIVP